MRVIGAVSLALISVLAGAQELSFISSADKVLPGDSPKFQSALRLAGSRGETLSFQLRLRVPRCLTLEVNLPPGVSLQLFEMETLRLKHASFKGAKLGDAFDPLVPLRTRVFCPVAGKDSRWVWGDLEISRDAKPGNLSGEIKLGNQKASLSLKLWPMTMPAVASLPAYVGLSSWFTIKGHYGRWHTGEGPLARDYAALLREHRLYSLQTWVVRPPILRNRGKEMIVDLNDAPSRQDSFRKVMLETRPDSAYVDFPKPPEKEAKDYWTAVEHTLQQEGLQRRALVYLWDEPKPTEMPALKREAALVKKYAPDVRVLVTTSYRPELKGLVDIFAPLMDDIGEGGLAGAEDYRKLRAERTAFWTYVSCASHGCDNDTSSGRPDFVIDRPSVYVRSAGWLAYTLGLDAFLYYSATNFYRSYPREDPWTTLWDFTGNGDGTLLYPARAGQRGFESDAPVPSLRLKLWREASFDYEYLKQMEALPQKPSWWSTELKRLVPDTKNWSRDYEAYSSLRERMGDELARSQR
ncbi:MAG: DUF4091 domain-containing protein [Bdellovibrionales bacterium]|nr:DUF4091 domain-containing protein [Bdellovibrionales bacterium]